MICIISCGSSKAKKACRAKELYTGSHFKRCLKWGLYNFKPDLIFILSAKYGLLNLNDVIEPYDLKMGQSGSITTDALKAQAIKLNIANEEVVSTCGDKYRVAIDKVFLKTTHPFKGLSMGYMAQKINNELKLKKLGALK